MSSESAATSTAKFQSILDVAFESYAKQTGIDLTKHPSKDKLQNCHSTEDVVQLLLERETAFNNYRDKYRKLIDCFRPIVQVVHAFSGVLGDAADLVQFKPTKAIFVGIDVLLSAASSVSSSYDALVRLFECVANFLKRLHIYTEKIPLSPMISDIAVKIMVEVISVLALATKQINQGRFKKFAKKLLGKGDIEAVLQRLDQLTQEEARVIATQTLEVVHEVADNLKSVMDDGKPSTSGIRHGIVKTPTMFNMKGGQLQDTRCWLSPPDPSTNHNVARRDHHDGTSSWFTMSGKFKEWKATGSLLWIHGKPGAGKSVLSSSIIQHVEGLCERGSALMGYFYCDFRNPKKQDVDEMLASLFTQLSARSGACYNILSALHSKYDAGARRPGDDALTDCLKNMLEIEGEPKVYIIIDALDESPNDGVVSPRERVLELVKKLVDLHLPNVRICATSRPEADIRAVLASLASHTVSLHDEDGQKKDIADYVRSIVYSNWHMQRWREKDKENVVNTLSQKADGMFRWIVCQLEVLKRSLPSTIRRILGDLPRSLDETYDRILLGIPQERREYAQRLFKCISVSIRPLRVQELAEILAIQFDEGALPEYDVDWRPENSEDDVLSVCSSLISIVDMDGSRVVQFSHFSVQEYLSSNRLANSGHDLSQYHILPHSAHTILAQASLSVLLALHEKVDKDAMKNFPLATYASRYWVGHAQFENVSSRIQGAMGRLFDTTKPYFATWVWIYDIDDPFREMMIATCPTPPEAVPLYYAALCGFRDLVEHLINTCPRDVNARGGYHCTPVHAAIAKRNIDVMKLLLAHGADVSSLGNKKRTPLHETSQRGCLEMMKLLLGRDVVSDAQDDEGMTPLYLASYEGELEVVRALLRHGASVDCRSITGWTPLQIASQTGHLGVAQLLFESGAAVNSQNNEGCTPLFIASQNGHLDVVDFLLQNGAAVDFCHSDGRTPLYQASMKGHLDVMNLLLQSGAAVDLPENGGWTPLHLASQEGRLDVVRLLLQSGAAVDGTSNDGWNPMHLASWKGHLDVVRLLLQNGATVNQNNHSSTTSSDSNPNKRCPTPLHFASAEGHLSIAQLLVSCGADPNTHGQDGKTPLDLALENRELEIAKFLVGHMGSTDSQQSIDLTALSETSQDVPPEVAQPSLGRTRDGNILDKTKISLHTASEEGNLGIVRSLLDNGADVNERNTNHNTPLYIAAKAGKVEVAKLLIEYDANANSRSRAGWAPLHVASEFGHFDIVHLLLNHSADVNARARSNDTALHLASEYGHFEVVELLLEQGANVHVRNDKGQTPPQLASRSGAWEIVRLLSEHGTHGT